MPTVVIDATGNLKAINNAFQFMAHGARYVLVGLQKGDISFNHPEFHKREATLMSSRNATRQDFEMVISSMKKGFVIGYIDKVPVDNVEDLNRILDFKKGGILLEGFYPNGQKGTYGVDW